MPLIINCIVLENSCVHQDTALSLNWTPACKVHKVVIDEKMMTIILNKSLTVKAKNSRVITVSNKTIQLMVNAPIVYRSGHRPFTAVSGVRFPVGVPKRVSYNGYYLSFPN